MQGPMTLYNNSQFLICRANEGITHLHTCALKNSFPMHSHWARVKKQKDKNKKKNKKTKKNREEPEAYLSARESRAHSAGRKSQLTFSLTPLHCSCVSGRGFHSPPRS